MLHWGKRKVIIQELAKKMSSRARNERGDPVEILKYRGIASAYQPRNDSVLPNPERLQRKELRMKAKPNRLPDLIFALSCALIFFGIFYPLFIHILNTPKNTFFTFASGYTFDYYQYLSWIRQGMDGHPLLITPYTQVNYSPTFIHPFFPLLGTIGRLVHLSVFETYTLSRIVSLAVFLIIFYLLASKVLKSVSLKSTSLFLLFTSSSFWWIQKTNGTNSLMEPLSWNQNFNILGKFNLPPHHLFALTLTMAVFLLLSNLRAKRFPLMAVILGIVCGFLNPGALLAANLTLFLSSFFLFLKDRHRHLGFLKKALFFLFFTSPVLIYHFYVFNHVLPWSYMYKLMQSFNPTVSLMDILLAFGPLLPLFFISLISPYTFSSELFILLVFWAGLPFLLLPLKGLLSVNYSRVFQIYSYIPMSILASIGVEKLFSFANKIKINTTFSRIIFFILLSIFAAVPYFFSIHESVVDIATNHYNIYVPKSLISTLNYLQNHSPDKSVVLSGEFVSSMIPAFTHNRTILGREDSAPDYFDKRAASYDFLNGKMTEKEARDFFEKYSLSYFLSGVDTIPYETLPIKSYSFLKEVYRSGTVALLEAK